MASLQTWLFDLLNLFSPRICPICNNHLDSHEEKVCEHCLRQLPYTYITDFQDNPVYRLFERKFRLGRVHSYLRYQHELSSHLLITRFKYGHRPDLAQFIGSKVARELLPQGFFGDIDGIVPVPLHWIRQWQRGYNQSAQIALGISEVTGIPVIKGVVKRTRNNETQTNKTAIERAKNVENLFHAIAGIPCRHILLVDDVLTTGATLTSCAQAIAQRNPRITISILTIGRA